jgi:DsbC/DsbD-like thiol-disulfide interchange protein
MRMLAALAVWLASLAASAQDSSPVDVRLVASTTAVEAGTPFDVGVLLHMQPGWHVYWLNPGDAGLATSVRWTLPGGFTAGPLRWPVPQRFEQPGGVVGYGYLDTVLLGARVTPPATLPAGTAVPVRVEVGWLACEKICVRGRRTLDVALGHGADPAAGVPGLFAEWAPRLPLDPAGPDAPATVTVRGGLPPDGKPGTITVDIAWKQAPAAVEWFPPDDPALDVLAARSSTDGGRTTLTLQAKRLAGQQPKQSVLESVIGYTDASGVRHGLRVPVDLDGKET